MGALRFLELMPEAGGGDALDLCGGAGSGAFRLSRTARSAATSDLTPRAAHFAAFNARLNGVDVESLQGDLYAPAAGRRFDVIAAHPPYVPEVGSPLAYRDGGETGERVTRGVVAGLPAHLKPGGRCAILCMGRDAEEGTFEERVRGWLGEARDEFDVVFGLETTLTAEEILDRMRERDEPRRRRRGPGLSRASRGNGNEAVRLRRSADRALRATGTVSSRSRLGDRAWQATAANFEPFLAWRRLRREPGLTATLGRARPRLLAPAWS